MPDVSGYGLRLNLVATVTFPFGITLSEFGDDSDPLDLPSMQIGDKAMGLNGDLLTWAKANPIIVNLSLIPLGTDDTNMSILFEANRVSKGKANPLDVITLTGVYPQGRIITLARGKITDGLPGVSVASAGRLKTKTYSLAFETMSFI